MKKNFSHNELFTFCTNVFLKMGCSIDDARLASSVLLSADMRGIDSHGVARLSGYVRLWKQGRINTKAQIKITRENATLAQIDGDAGLGLVIAPKAMQIAIDKAKKYGSGWVSVGNSNHFGIAAYHAMMALQHDMIGMSMTNASPLVAPTFSSERMLGTNPICYAIPAGKHKPYIMDMATSAAANGKLEIAQRKNLSIPNGWAQTKEGCETTNANELKNGGSLLPLGSDKDHGSHKGYGLGAVVDVLSGVLSGANFGPWVPPFVSFLPVAENLPGKGLGHFLGAMQIEGFCDVAEFKNRMDSWLDRFKNAVPKDPSQPVIVHGVPEYMEEEKRKLNGIPLVEAVFDDLQVLAKELNIKL